MNSFLIFLVDDDPIFLKVLETQFKEKTQYEIRTFSTGEDCLKNISLEPNVIFLDYNLNTTNPKANNGLQILDKIKAADRNIHVVILSSQESIEVTLNCMKHQAFDYIVKSESVFLRAQKVVSAIFNQKKLEKKVKIYRTTSVTLIISIAGTIAAAIITELIFRYFIR